ncbi:MAG TPA: hypothetical protein VFV72_01070 [Candidatus Limnocylindrales bacterium]|nr:hypothetical protein [Candidatus Limnocylindrales bacterium]
MTTAFNVHPAPARAGASPLAVVAIVFVAAIAFVTLVTAGITFAALTVAFPAAVPIAQYYDVPFTAADAAIAEAVAGYWWAFAALAVTSFGGAALVAVGSIRAISSSARA